MQIGDLVALDSGRDIPLTGIVTKIDESHKVGIHAFPCFVVWNTGETDWMRKEFLEIVSASR